MKTTRLLIAAFAMSLLAASCTSAGSSTSLSPTAPPLPTTAATSTVPTSVPATTSTVAATTSTTVAPTTTVADACAVVAAPVPAGVVGVSTAGGDFDGDTLEDELMVYGEGAPGPWHLRVTLDTGFVVDLTIPGNEMLARAVGGLDLDLDGDDDIFAVVGSGASAFVVGLFTYVDCQVLPITIAGDPETLFAVGASAGNQAGLQCLDPGGLAVYTQSTSDGVTYQQQIDEYGVLDNVMTLEGSVALTLTSPLDDGQIFIAGEFDCGALSLF